MPARRYNDEIEAEIAAAFDTEGVFRLAKKWNISKKTVYEIVDRQGVERPHYHRRWEQGSIVVALRQFEAEYGHRPSCNELNRVMRARDGYPSCTVVARHFGSFANACVVAFGESRASGGYHVAKDEDTEEVIRGLAAGATLVSLARARGISGPALGRRVRRYKKAYGLR